MYRILINAAVDDGSRLARMMSNFTKADFNDPMFPELSRQIRQYKHMEGGKQAVSQRFADMMEEYAKERVLQQKVESVELSTSEWNISLEKACKVFGFSSVDEYLEAKKTVARLDKEEAIEEFIPEPTNIV